MNALPPEGLLAWAKVVEAGGVGRAAGALGISQPAVSARLKRLAEAAGGPLFRRTREGLVPTPLGAALLPQARALARLLSALPEPPPLRIAASQTVAGYYLPRWLAAAGWPGRAAIEVSNSRRAVERLLAGEADLALIEAPPPPDPGLEARPLGEDELVLALPPGHPLAGRRRAGAGELSDLDLLLREPGSGTRELALAALARLGVRPRVRLTIGGLEPLKEAVAAGLGAAFLPRVAARAAGLGYLRLRGPRLVRPLTLLLARQSPQTARGLAARFPVS